MKPALSETDRSQIFGWAPDIFGVGDLPVDWRLKDLHFIAYDGSLATSHVGTVLHTVKVAGEEIGVCGVGGVTTRPEYQSRGLAHALLGEALTHGRESGASHGFLFCFPRLIPFYQSQDWKLLEVPVLVQQQDAEVGVPVRAMVLPLADARWPSGPVRTLSKPW